MQTFTAKKTKDKKIRVDLSNCLRLIADSVHSIVVELSFKIGFDCIVKIAFSNKLNQAIVLTARAKYFLYQ